MKLLALWLLFVLIVTLYPYDSLSTAGHLQRQSGFELGLYRQEWGDVVRNVLLFAPLGVLLSRYQHPSKGRVLAALLAGVAAALISSAVERLQIFLPGRNASLLDILSNTLGAVAGAIVHGTWRTSFDQLLVELRQSSAASLRATAVFVIIALAVTAALQVRTRLSNWNDDYPLLIGNERTGNRPWLGHVVTLEMTDAATPSQAVHQFSVDGSIELAGERLAAFDFSGKAPYRDAAGNVPALQWVHGATESSAHGVVFTGHNWLRSTGAASSLVARVHETNAFTLRVVCATKHPLQAGPARIVSNSGNPELRNFTIAQDRTDLIVRLRTPTTGLNGNLPQFRVPGVFSDDGLRDILVTYDGSVVLATVSHSGRVSRFELMPGSIVAAAFRDVQGEQLWKFKWGYIAALFVAPGVLLGFVQSRDAQLRLTVLSVLGFSVLLESVLVVASGRFFDWYNVAITAAVGSVMVNAVAVLVRVSTRRFSTGPHVPEAAAQHTSPSDVPF